MMEFLDKIYSYEHFGIILFSIIGVLIVAFLIVLFFGKKDEKKRKLEETQRLQQQTMDTFKETTPEVTPLEVVEKEPVMAPVENEVPIVEPIATDMPIVTEPAPVVEPVLQVSEPELNTMPVNSMPILEPIAEPSIVTTPVEEVSLPVSEPISYQMPEVQVEPLKEEPTYGEIEIPKFNFDELAASIASELEEIEQKQEVVKMPETTVTEPTVTRMDDIVKRERPVQTFSSVYVNKPVEPVINEQIVPPVAQEVVVAPVEEPVVPVRPVQNLNIELPKPAEMPVLKQNMPEPTPVVSETPTMPDFTQFEGESYNLK